MTVRFLALYETPTDPEASDRHYREVQIPLGRQLPGLRRYAVGRDVAAVRGVPYYLVTELEWDTMEELRTAGASPEGRGTARRRRSAACGLAALVGAVLFSGLLSIPWPGHPARPELMLASDQYVLYGLAMLAAIGVALARERSAARRPARSSERFRGDAART
jgi:uncharacterized protein (TIGR02118 family)